MSADEVPVPEGDADVKMLREAAEKLSEHFDSVHIFTTRYESSLDHGTVNVNYGTGNWFARYGQIRTWLVKAEEQTRCDVRGE